MNIFKSQLKIGETFGTKGVIFFGYVPTLKNDQDHSFVKLVEKNIHVKISMI